jgi:hypothetical protein
LRIAAAAAIQVAALGGMSAAPVLGEGTPWSPANWSISEFQPKIGAGGRANTIAMDPHDNNTALVASESGGLFKTTDDGKTWHHIENLKPYYTNSVAFLQKHAGVAIATTSEDFSASNQGGIWRSEDGGETWSPVVWSSGGSGSVGPGGTAPPPSPSPPGLNKGYGAFEISVAPDTGRIFVASTAGVEVGTEDGKTWTHHDPGGTSQWELAVLALPEAHPGGGNIVLLGGPKGLWRSTNGGADNWGAGPIQPNALCDAIQHQDIGGCIMDMHALGGQPLAKNQAYAVNVDKELYYSEDAGLTWRKIWQTPSFYGGCGGIALAQARPSRNPLGSLDVYVSDRCDIFKLTAAPVPGSNAFSYPTDLAKWKALVTDHGNGADHLTGDSRGIAFNNDGAPIYVATDGGVHRWSHTEQQFLFVGGGPGGYNALQIFQVRGQWIADVSRNNLYFGTQDNWLHSSSDTGQTWVRCCNEGAFFEWAHRVATAGQSQITISLTELSYLAKTTSFGDGFTDWPNPPNNPGLIGRPKFVEKNFHVQWVVAASCLKPSPTGGVVLAPLLKRGLAVTTNLGKSTAEIPCGWQQYAVINDPACGSCNRLDLPRASYPKKGGPVLYQMLDTGSADAASGLHFGALARLLPKPNAPDATTDYPAMQIVVTPGVPPAKKPFGGFGRPPAMTDWLHVLGVDPWHPNHLLAPDVINQTMLESTDGGVTWTEMTQLTQQVTDSGTLNFRGRQFFNQNADQYPADFFPISLVSAISFYPEGPDQVALGTTQNGIFLSQDGGKIWIKVPGSEKATLITSIYWRSANDLIVSTYGRGLWRVSWKNIGKKLECGSAECTHVYYQRPPRPHPSPYDLVIMAFGGRIRGVRLQDGIVGEIFVQPGTTLTYGVDTGEVPDIKVTDTTASMRSLGAARLPAAPRGSPVISGLTLTRIGRQAALEGVLFSRGPRSLFTPPARQPAVVRSAVQAAARPGPFLQALSATERAPGEEIRLQGSDLPAGVRAELRMDGLPMMTVTAEADGTFTASLRAPGLFGLHAVTLVVDGRTVSGLMISVRPGE